MPESPIAVSAVLLCYDCESYIGKALRSVLAQDHDEPIEIIVSDDASTDGTLEVVHSELDRYAGPHSVRLLRQPTNAGGKSAHLNRVVPITSGDVIVSFDGDDISEPTRVRRIVERFRQDPEIKAVYSDYTRIDASGRTLGPGRVPHPPPGTKSNEWFAQVDAYAAGGTLAVRREVFETFGPLDPDIHEDIVLPFRASLLGETAFISDPLIKARRHAASLTADMDRVTSLAAYRARMHLGIERARRNVESRLTDIRVAESLMPERAGEFETLRRIVAESMEAAELSGQLYSPSLASRIGALVRLTMRGAYRDQFAQHAAIVLAPRLYLSYKRRELGLK